VKIAQQHLNTAKPPLPRTAICKALKLSRATYYRAVSPPQPAAPPVEKRVPRRIPDPERDRIFALVCQPDYAELPPAQICARMLEAGTVLCSERSMYRILHENRAIRERRTQREHPRRVKPQLTATGPNQVWTWDITKIPGPVRGQFFHLYVVLDLYSRYVVAWTLAETESSAHAQTLFKHGVRTQQLEANRLTVHADNGSAMKSHGLAAVFENLGVARSFSRPRVSNDNAFSEAQFKTVKYHPGYPGRFESLHTAQEYFEKFFAWYNHEHHHSGLAMFTPATVYSGRHVALQKTRQAKLDDYYAKHPERFVKGPPRAPNLPDAVAINPDKPLATLTSTADPAAAELKPGKAG